MTLKRGHALDYTRDPSVPKIPQYPGLPAHHSISFLALIIK